MVFQKGNSGKPKGAVSLLKRHVRDRAEALGIDPFEILLYFAAGDWEKLGYDQEKYIASASEWGTVKKYTIEPSVRCKAAVDAASYIYPKLKSIEYTKNDALSGMSNEQKLEAMKHGVAALELEVQLSKTDTKRKK